LLRRHYHGRSRRRLPAQGPDLLRDEEIEAVADYVIARQQGKGAPSRDDCVAFWGANSHECAAMR
jgi:hypothetical protein